MLTSGIVATRAVDGSIAGYAVTGGIGLAVFVSRRNPLIWMGLGMIAFMAASAARMVLVAYRP